MSSESSKGVPPRPPLQNPIAGTTIDTAPKTLGIDSGEQSRNDPAHSLIAQGAKKLFHLPGRSTSPSPLPSKPSSGRRISPRNSPDIVAPRIQRASTESSATSSKDSSPFLRDLSPPPHDDVTPKAGPYPARPSIAVFRGEGSMRAGTQMLIQALQAVPWEQDPDNLDEALALDISESESEEAAQVLTPISSSIHTIYRPIARSRRNTPATATAFRNATGYFPDTPPSLSPEIEAEEEDAEDDFEQPHAQVPQRAPAITSDQLGLEARVTKSPIRYAATRSGSLATVRLMRRARLASKLKEIFELDDIYEVIAEMPCWLLRSVLLQGYMYLTNSHLCFFAHIPAREDQVLKSGSLYKKTTRTKRWVKRWFILKNDALSWYQSSSDPYFPHGVVDLRYAISCEASSDKDFTLRTNQKTVLISADSATSRDEWVKAIRKVVFKAQNMGESVKIAIPYSAILEVDRSTAMDFSETLEVKVVDNHDNFSLDSYFFAYFHDLSGALQQIRDVLHSSRLEPEGISSHVLKDTTARRPVSLPPIQEVVGRSSSTPIPDPPATSKSYGFRMPSLLRSLSPGDGHERRSSLDIHPNDNAHNTQRGTNVVTEQEVLLSHSARSSCPSSSSYDHAYPPSPSPPPPLETNRSTDSPNPTWSVSVPSWLKGSSLRLFTGASSRDISGSKAGAISEVYTHSPSTILGAQDDDHEFDLVEPTLSTRHGFDPGTEEKFRRTFAVDEKEELLGWMAGYLLRVLPVHGRFFISTRYLCFRSSQSLIKTRMMVPIHDIIAAQQCKAFQFGCYGLLIVIKGHEELFFEFRTAQRRASCIELLDRQMELCRTNALSSENVDSSQQDAIILEELEPTDILTDDDPRPPSEALMESLPAVMFTSASSTFLSFKPQHPLRFTFLTIGSRGDVQPYIALGKGLMADGHKVTIATHEEYKEWVTSYGIDFACVGGDPAELMRICVENGMFTVSFLKETLSKFRGWLDDLLKSSWEACQGADVLVESPSAMGGLHIAEALRIPYFRAFTMPWTRTRVYPHAFAVPEHKMGGSYNYMSYVMFDQVFWRATSGQINRWRRDCLGIGPTNLDKMMQHKVPFLYNFSPAVVPPPLDWVEWIRVTGYWFLEDADVGSKKWDPPADLVSFIDEAHAGNHKVVYIGFGSIVVSDPVAMTECVIKAIEDSGVYAILSKGWSDRLHSKKGLQEEAGAGHSLPPQIYEISSIPHDWLFSRIDAACHHGGAGTTGASLRAGIPTIIKPFFGDQFFWSERVEALGVGSSVRKLTVEQLTAALHTATTDLKQIDRAKLLGQAIRAENGVKTAIEAIYRDLEYARTLIQRHPVNEVDKSPSGTIAARRDRSSFNETIRRPNSSLDSSNGNQSEDWSIVSGEDHSKSPSRNKSTSRRKLVTKPLHALHDALASASSTLSQVL